MQTQSIYTNIFVKRSHFLPEQCLSAQSLLPVNPSRARRCNIRGVRRFLILFLALLLPLQAVTVTAATISAQAGEAFEHTQRSKAHNVAETRISGAACACQNSGPAGAHCLLPHACSHFGLTMIARLPATSVFLLPSALRPQAETPSFKSVVLDVPSPPPTHIA